MRTLRPTAISRAGTLAYWVGSSRLPSVTCREKVRAVPGGGEKACAEAGGNEKACAVAEKLYALAPSGEAAFDLMDSFSTLRSLRDDLVSIFQHYRKVTAGKIPSPFGDAN